MKCPKCGSRLGVTHTYQAGTKAQTQRRWCEKCHITYTTVVQIITEDPQRGDGAAALAERMKKAAPM